KAPGQHGAIRYSLAALKNIGASAVESIVAERAQRGPYKSLADFASRFQPKALNKRGLETMAAAGAFDTLEANRALVHANVDQIMATAQRIQQNEADGIIDMFGGGGSQPAKLDLRGNKRWTPMERLGEEFKAIGFYLSGHPLDSYGSVLAKMGVTSYAEFEPKAGLQATAAKLAAIVVSAREKRSQKGNKFAFAMFSDATAQFEAVIFSDTLNACGHLLEPGTPVIVSVEAERVEDAVKMRVQGLQSLDEAAASVQRGLRIVLDRRLLASKKITLDGFKGELKAPTGGPKSGGEIRIALELDDRERVLEFAIPGKFDVGPNMQGHLSTIPGVLDVVEL
ncbi:MAG TPA: DNA polymerase III subunit alpha, partial [Hyphomicrobiaceae bacterium]|nr:DNA polymerase III subunit alpha [Hyphomicrobiaceae bacterium]